MELKLGFALLAYYTWWLIVLVCTCIVLYKLLTNQSFSVGVRFGIQSASETYRDFVFQPILVHRRNGNTARETQTPNAAATATPAILEGDQVQQ